MADVAHDTTHEHGDHDPNLQHHFETMHQQFDASKLGMWLFLMTEVLFFGGLFCAYAIYRRTHPQIFEVGQHFLNVWMGATNTAVLIASSFTMAMGVWCAQRSYRKGLILCLVLTLMGAVTFMVIKYFEYEHKIHTGKVWGDKFNPITDAEYNAKHHGGHAVTPLGADEHAPAVADSHATPPQADDTAGHAAAEPTHAAPPAEHAASAVPTETGALVIEKTQIALAPAGPGGVHAEARRGTDAEVDEEALYARARQMKDLQIFMGIYYCMTGLHGIHVLAGIVVISGLLVGAIKGRYHGGYYTPVDLIGLYWHVVDLVWIFLFPLFYLID
jgi:cytochrome c oxidase subunit 3